MPKARSTAGRATQEGQQITTAIRAVVRGEVQRVGFRDATVRRARELGVLGWVRNREEGVVEEPAEGRTGAVEVHAEGPAHAVEELVAFLREGPPPARVAAVDVDSVAVEGHEQFAVRGISAGVFVVQEHLARAHHFDLRLEVGGVMRSWAVPKGPSLDPAVKRLAVQVPDHAISHNSFEGALDGGRVIVWDRGVYEQGGRVAWPAALEHGHAVFVLHGEKLRGGFALQRTGGGPKAQWLLIKRRDDHARPGSDVVAEHPRSVLGGRTLEETGE
ncbi:MAG: DNA polymerase ligase N-terminal domain-containing protein [Solirubrobacteraceae bacterium]|jgi:DNA ligase D-like protein (predicted 3'-phosphoesterase)